MSTTENDVEKLLQRAAAVVENADNEPGVSLVRDLAAKLREYHPIVNPKPPVVENPNVVAWRPHVKQGLELAIVSLKMTLKTEWITGTTFIRRSVMKDGGVKAKLGIKFKANVTYNRSVDPKKIIQRTINEYLAAEGLPPVAVTITSGSQMQFSARVHLQGDEDYEHYTKWRI